MSTDGSGDVTPPVSPRDVTEPAELAERLLAVRKFESLGRLAGGAAHDFNNLLAVVIATADRLRTGPVPEDKRAALLSNILQAAEATAELTGQLLTFSRTSAVAGRPLDLSVLVRQTCVLLGPAMQDGVVLVTDLAPDLPPVVADPAELKQLLVELVVNSRDAMPGGGRLEIRTTTADARPGPEDATAPGPYAVLRVRDSGEGMTPAVRARIFEPFFTTKPPGRGTGLGLATVPGILSRAHGFVEVDSAAGQGTTVTVYLPAAPAPGV